MINDTSECSIIVADDDPDNLIILSEMLEQDGYVVRAYNNGLQVIESAEKMPPDMFLLDVHMGVLDGYETCLELKRNKNLKDIPIIFISGLSESYNKVRGFELGAVDYINKPFSLAEVKSRVKTHITLGVMIKELREMNAGMINREVRVIELKEEVNKLSKELGRKPPYDAVWEDKIT